MARCSYCYTHGHNKRTCPKLTAKLKERADAAIAAGNPDSWVVEKYKERIAPKKKKGQKLGNMVCGYCFGVGHTRRKCEAMERDKVIYEKHHNMVLRVVRDYISSCDFMALMCFRIFRCVSLINMGLLQTSWILTAQPKLRYSKIASRSRSHLFV